MNMDISYLLDSWEFDPEKAVRLIRAEDGRQVMQVRLPLGIEQYELDGRPDGLEPFGKPSVLDEVQSRLELHISEHLDDSGFHIDEETMEHLQNEGLLFYYRYVLLFQIGDYERSARDSEHNLTICAVVEKYAASTKDAQLVIQYKPYMIRVNAIARAMIAFNQDDRDAAATIIGEAIEKIRGMPEVETTIFQFERMRSLTSLKETLEQVYNEDTDEVGRLQSELQNAVESENYERAVEIRDEIAFLERDGGVE